MFYHVRSELLLTSYSNLRQVYHNSEAFILYLNVINMAHSSIQNSIKKYVCQYQVSKTITAQVLQEMKHIHENAGYTIKGS